MSIDIPILGFVAWSGTGKTTLITRILPILNTNGVRVGMIKHTHHNVEFDTPGKDSYKLRHAGAQQMLVTSSTRWALFGDKREYQPERDINSEVSRLNTDELDIVLVESFKTAPIPKIELHRPSLGKPFLFPNDPHIVAIASDEQLAFDKGPDILDLNDPSTIAHYIMRSFLGNALSQGN
ncbi:MAG: molybdopterin-guanine dinucleotide biosynthesis protein B [Pseudomonadota bacterium]